MAVLTKTLEIKDRILHLEMILPVNFKSKKVKIIITSDDDVELKNPIKNLKGKLDLSDKQYSDIQNFLNEDR